MTAPIFAFAPAPKRPVAPVAIAFLTPINHKAPARKTHRLVVTGAGGGLPRLVTTGYGGADEKQKAARFTHCTRQVADIEELFEALRLHSQQNCLVIRGQVRPDAGAVIYRRMAEEGADILDTPSRLIVIDLDHEVAPVGLDVDDDQAVGEYLRGRLPAELRDVSCVVQFSNSYGLWRLEAGRKQALKAHIWLLNDEPVDGVELRRWMVEQNRIGECGQLDPQVTSANQPIYSASPIFQDCVDPVPQRLFLLLSDSDRDVASVRPPAAPVRTAYAPGAVGERQPEKLTALAAGIRRAVEDGQPRHPAINAAAFTAGRLVAGGAFTVEEALAALMPVALESGSDGAERAVRDGLLAGMTKGSPILIGGQRISDMSELPQAWQLDPTAPVSLAEAEARIAAIFTDVIATPLNPDGTRRVAIIRSTTGIGKTQVAIRELVDQHKTLWFAPTHELSDETEDRIIDAAPQRNAFQKMARPLPARAMRGRGAKQRGSDDKWMCGKPESLKAIKEAGVSRHTKALICKNKSAACEHLQHGQCPYFQQMHNASPIRIVAHSYLGTPQAEALGDWTEDAVLAVIDENPLNSLQRKSRWADVSDRRKASPLSPWFLSPTTRAVAGAILDGATIPPDEKEALLAAIQEALAAIENEVPAVEPWMSDSEAAATLKDFKPQVDPALLGILMACARYLSGATNSLWLGKIDGKPALFSGWIADPLSIAHLPVVVLDATASQEMYQSIFSQMKRTVEFHEINVAISPDVFVTQVIDSTFYKRKLTEGASAKKMTARLAAFIAAESGWSNEPTVGFISNKVVVDNVQDRTPCLALHFGDLNGRDTLRDCPTLIIAGRTEPGADDAEAMARALWPTEALNLTGALTPARSFYQMRDGSRVEAVVRTHADPNVDACVRFVREVALIQAVGRGRYVRSTGPRQLFILTSVPIPGLIVDRLVTTDELLPDWRLAEALLAGHGTALLSATWLAENCADAFPNLQSAKDFSADFKVEFPGNRAIYPESLLSKLKEVTYFLEGQRGGRGRRAVTSAPNLKLAAGAIESLIGTSVRKICWSPSAQEEVAAGASVEVAAAPVEVPAPPLNPVYENPSMTSLRPDTDPPTVIPPGVGNIHWLLGCAFDADWSPTEEVRSVVWTVTLIDGAIQTLCLPENPGYASAHATARRMIPLMHHVAVAREAAA